MVSQDEQEEVKGHIRFLLGSLTAAVLVPGVSPCPFKVSLSSGQQLGLLILQAQSAHTYTLTSSVCGGGCSVAVGRRQETGFMARSRS